MTAAAMAAARGGDTPMMRAALDALARLPANNNDNGKFAVAGYRGGGGGGGWTTSSRMIIDPGSIRAAIGKENVRGSAAAWAEMEQAKF